MIKNECPIDPECVIGPDGMHSKYHLAPTANSKIIKKERRCVYCNRDVEKCNDRVDMINGETGEVIATNVKMVWGRGFSIDPKHLEKP